MTSIPPTNSLGLDFNDSEPTTTTEAPADNTESQPAPQSPTEQPHREKKKPYVNPDRVKTGGPQREKLTDEELAERMARMREQNEKIKQRRLDVAADEAAFKQAQEVDRQKMERTKKIQGSVDKAREQNVKRKMDKAQNREWDSGKPTIAASKNQIKKGPSDQEPATTEYSQPSNLPGSQSSTQPTEQPAGSNHWARGGGPSRGERGRGRGRGRGGRIPPATPRKGMTAKKEEELQSQEAGERKEARIATPSESS